MGWTYTNRKPGESVKAFFEHEFGSGPSDIAHDIANGVTKRVLDCAVVGARTAYLAFEQVIEERPGRPGSRDVFAIVCLLDLKGMRGFNIGYKDMDETMGPIESDCPERILKLLTPTDNADAKEWRERCWSNLRKRQARPKLSMGDVLITQAPVRFRGGDELQTFVVVAPRSLTVRAVDSSGLYKLRWPLLEGATHVRPNDVGLQGTQAALGALSKEQDVTDVFAAVSFGEPGGGWLFFRRPFGEKAPWRPWAVLPAGEDRFVVIHAIRDKNVERPTRSARALGP